jgi:hypothetical protein
MAINLQSRRYMLKEVTIGILKYYVNEKNKVNLARLR